MEMVQVTPLRTLASSP